MSNPAVAGLRQPTLVRLPEVQASLHEDEALFSFQLADRMRKDLFQGGSWLLVVTARSATAYPVADQRELEPAIRMYRAVLTDTGFAPAEGSVRLYRELFEEALDDLPTGLRRLIVVPDDALHDLPFSTLRASENALPIALQYQVDVVPSATLWRRWRQTAQPQGRIPALALADPGLRGSFSPGESAETREGVLDEVVELRPLPFARKEGESIVRRLGGGSELLTGDVATESRLKTVDLNDFDVVHFAAHAVIDRTRPERSGVVLAPGSAGRRPAPDARDRRTEPRGNHGRALGLPERDGPARSRRGNHGTGSGVLRQRRTPGDR